MTEFLLAHQNLPFTVALAVMLVIAVLEGISATFGASVSGFLDNWTPDADVDVDVGADVGGAEIDAPGALSHMLGWLHIGKLPIMMLLVVFLTAFGLIGLGVQSVARDLMGALLPGSAASALALIAALPVVRLAGGLLARMMPHDETEAVSEKSFIGRVAVITLGRSKKGSPTQAKLKDAFGHTHYVLVEPDLEDEIFEVGNLVVLVNQQGAVFRAIRNPSAALVDE
jgi:hypothetical protein